MSTPTPDPLSSPLGPPDATPFKDGSSVEPMGMVTPQGNEFKKIDPSLSKSMQEWMKFLGSGATPDQVRKFQANCLNMISVQMREEENRAIEESKKAARMARGEDE